MLKQKNDHLVKLKSNHKTIQEQIKVKQEDLNNLKKCIEDKEDSFRKSSQDDTEDIEKTAQKAKHANPSGPQDKNGKLKLPIFLIKGLHKNLMKESGGRNQSTNKKPDVFVLNPISSKVLTQVDSEDLKINGFNNISCAQVNDCENVQGERSQKNTAYSTRVEMEDCNKIQVVKESKKSSQDDTEEIDKPPQKATHAKHSGPEDKNGKFSPTIHPYPKEIVLVCPKESTETSSFTEKQTTTSSNMISKDVGAPELKMNKDVKVGMVQNSSQNGILKLMHAVSPSTIWYQLIKSLKETIKFLYMRVSSFMYVVLVVLFIFSFGNRYQV